MEDIPREKGSPYQKPLLEKQTGNHVREYLFPLSEEERKELKAIIDELPPKVIDLHTHIGPKESVKRQLSPTTYGEVFPSQRLGSLSLHKILLEGRLIKQGPHKKVYSIVFGFPFSPSTIDYSEVDQYLRKFLRASLNFIPFLIPQGGEKGVRETKEALESKFYWGIGEAHPELVNPPAENLRGKQGFLAEDILKIAQEQKLPLIIHLPKHLLNHLEEIRELSDDYPGIKIVLAHVGHVYVLTERSKKALDQVLSLPNVYFDTSTVTEKEVFKYVLEKSGSGKLLFATDAPFDALRIKAKFIEGKMRLFSSQGLPGTEKAEEEVSRMLISSPKALLEAIKEVYPDKKQAGLAKENIFFGNALEILPRKLPSLEEKFEHGNSR